MIYLFFCFLKFIIEVGIAKLDFYETIPLQCKLLIPKLKYFNMIILDVFSDFSSVESEFCIEEKFGLKLALVSISYATLL